MTTIIVSVIVAIAALVGMTSYYFSGPDNKVEESCEKIIEGQTGQDIDLSPSTPESSSKIISIQEKPSAEEIADAKINP